MSYRRIRETMDGNTAAAYISYHFTEVAAIYPITPSSPMAEAVDNWASKGRENIFGRPVKLIEMQSEAGAAGTMHGSLQAGALTTTYTSSQGLLLMIPNLYKMAGELLPGVLHVSARSLASNALSIFGDHQDVMSIRQTGVALLASGSVQECMDLGCVSHLVALESRIPFVHFFDGFRTSHEIQKIEVIEKEDVCELVNKEAIKQFRDRALNPDHPVLRGTTQNPDIFFQEREAVNSFYDRLPEIVQLYMNKVGELTGRQYQLFDYYGNPNAKHIFVAMGSSCEVIKETIDYLNQNGEECGLVEVHLYRPFSIKHFLQAVPVTAEKIVVLDRTKEPGAGAEPLCLDVSYAFSQVPEPPFVLGGRYGLASKDFAPEDVIAVLKNLKSNNPKNPFTVGVDDDVTYLSLPKENTLVDTVPRGTISCKFWGLGSDGTVGANKSAIKIIGNHTQKQVQAYFAYDSKKSGGLTVSHLRIGESSIRSSYLINYADYIACHNQSYIQIYDCLDGIKENGTFVLNSIWDEKELKRQIEGKLKNVLLEKKVNFYVINAVHIAEKLGLGKRINMIMQSVFFYLTKIIPFHEAEIYLKEEVVKNYGHQGQEVIDKNFAAIEEAKLHIHKIEWTDEEKEQEKKEMENGLISTEDDRMNHFVNNIMVPMNRQKGDTIPVSVFEGIEDGTFPTGTTQYEKRGIALKVPEWNSDRCIQCNQCSFVCPHSVLRPVLLCQEEWEKAPLEVKRKAKQANGHTEKYFYMGISTMDCTGCGNCINVCPTKEKALKNKSLNTDKQDDEKSWKYIQSLNRKSLGDVRGIGVKESQFLPTYFEFSGACAGCGETPYARMITQLFGDRMMISNSAGCATVWGGSAPAIPYRKDKEGHGPAWGFSLFEDNGEYGLGMYVGYQTVREEIRQKIEEIRKTLEEKLDFDDCKELMQAITNWKEHYQESTNTREYANALIEGLEFYLNKCFAEDVLYKNIKEVLDRKDFIIKRSNWIFGGDGWAYDIGYGGLDHVLSTGADVNIMVFDTEVYSNTGGQSSKSTPKAAIAKFAAGGKQRKKKELGMMAIQYGDVYVAQIAMGANPTHAIKVIQEAESYSGPSLIIGYAPCINHGIQGGMGQTQLQQKKAVDAGYWNLYRYDPRRKEQGKNPFQLDSGKPKSDFKEFIMSEVRFSSLMKKDPELAERLYQQAAMEAQERYKRYEMLSRTKE